MKRFLLIAGINHYPEAGTGDWVGLYETREAAENAFRHKNEKNGSLFLLYGWYRIVDLLEVVETGVIPEF